MSLSELRPLIRLIGRDTRRFVILTSMLTPRSNLKRAVAVLLPTSLLWVFAACVSICGWESAAAHDQPHFASAVEVTETENAPDCEVCPDASFLKATTSVRLTFEPELQAARGVSSSILSVASSADGVTLSTTYRQPFLADPLLQLLPTLRI